MTMDLTGVKAGDELLLVERHNQEARTKTVTVHRVGRTLIHILRYPDRPETDTYRIDSGARNDNYGHSQLETRAHFDERQLRTGLHIRLTNLGVSVRMGLVSSSSRLSTAKLRALLEIMEDESL